MKHIFNAFRWLWLAFFIYLGVDVLKSNPEQIKKDRDFIEFQMKPLVNFVKNFQKQHGRLPSQWEFCNKAFDSSDNKTLESYMCPGVYIRSNISSITDEKVEFKNANFCRCWSYFLTNNLEQGTSPPLFQLFLRFNCNNQ